MVPPRGDLQIFQNALRGAACLAALVASAPALGQPDQTPADRVQIERTDAAPTIDGRLDDAVWDDAPRTDHFTQTIPSEGAKPSERTEFRFLYDDRYLYIGFHCYDREPDKIIARSRLRDELPDSDDRIAIVFDPFLDHRNGFMFVLNPNGSRRDLLVENSRNIRADWDGIWTAKAEINDRGWSGEMRIPFQTLSYDPEIDEWGMNILRVIRRHNEQVRWTNAVISRSFLDLGNIGRLTGIEDINQGFGLDVVPSVSYAQNHRQPSRDYGNFDPSLDVFYKITPSLTGVVTANTNFKETEVDDIQLNLTRFGLFFSENRDFFLQDAGVFEDFGGIPQNGRPFFSRSIGFIEDDLGPIREEIPIRVGAKLVGRVGPVNLGLKNIQTGRRGDLENKNLSVARVSYNVGRESLLGVVATRGDPSTNGNNYLWGIDYRYRNSRVFEKRAVNADFWFQRSSSSGLVGRSGSSASFGFLLEYPNDRFNWRLGAQEIEKNFRPALGFINREGIRRYDAFFRARTRPKDSWIRTLDSQWEGFVVTGTGNDLESADLRGRWLQFANQAGDQFWIGARHSLEVLREPFEIGGEFIPTGRYSWNRFGLSFESATSRVVSIKTTVGYGDFYNGTLFSPRVTLTWRPSPLFIGEIFFQQAAARLPSGDFTQRLVRVRTVFAFNPDLSWEMITQYDAVEDDLGFQTRLRWIIEPGRELFLVWNHEFDADGARFESEASQGVIKLKWTLRF